MNTFFYNHVTHTHVMLFASIFDEMEVWDYDANGKAVGRIPVPIKLTYKEKVVNQLLNSNYKDPYILRDNENVLPMISISLKGMRLDTERIRGIREKRKLYIEYQNVEGSNRPVEFQHMDMQTIPYKLDFEVLVWTKYMDHNFQIVENINAFIHPEIYLEMYEKGLGIGRKVKITKTGETPNFNVDIADNDFRSKFLVWAYNFDMECNLYKPEEPVGKPIKKITVRHSAVHGTNRTQGTDLAEQTVTQTVDNLIVDTSGSSGTSGTSGYCFYDYDSEIVNYIRKYSDEEFTQIRDDYKPLINCQTPTNIIPPPLTLPQPLAYGEVSIPDGVITITIDDPNIINAPVYIPQALINTKTGPAPFSIVNYENIQPGQFDVRFNVPVSGSDFSIVWYTYQKYNNQGN